jgi:RimJ/RimL family protein N-acetyltransferase
MAKNFKGELDIMGNEKLEKLFETERLNIFEAVEFEIDRVMTIEEEPENRDFIWQGTYEEHLEEIGSDEAYLLTFKKKGDEELVGYCLIRLDKASEVFELRRIAITEKKQGYGREVMKGLFKFCFEELKMNRFWLDVYPHNDIGIALYKSLGMVYEGTHRQSFKSEKGYLDQMIFSTLKGEYFEMKKK